MPAKRTKCPHPATPTTGSTRSSLSTGSTLSTESTGAASLHLLQHFARISEAPDAISRLRRFILDLAVRGKLVPQKPEEQSASGALLGLESPRQEDGEPAIEVSGEHYVHFGA